MSKLWTRTLLVVVALIVVAGALGFALRGPQEAAAQGAGSKGGGGTPHYSVIETNGQNLLVTDNSTHTLYFYTIDKEDKIGAPLKLRGSIDLTQVGKPEIRITPINPQK
jgi:hypothetical protein